METVKMRSNREATMHLNVSTTGKHPVSPYLAMQFMEPLGTADSSVDAAWDYLHETWRGDLLDTVRSLGPGMIRWGGCFASYYHWREAVGPMAERVPMHNSCWDGIYLNHVGTAEGFNGRESSLTDVRCIFELNEWIEFYPDTDATYGLRVWILKHRDDQEYYNTAKFSDLDPNFANYCDLHYPEDAENPDKWYWGSFYLHSDECEPGYYDFVFTYEGKAIATLLTRFYTENELTVKSDAELEALMHE